MARTVPDRASVRILTVDPATRRVEGGLRDGGVIQISIIDIGPYFRWPKQEEVWTVLRRNNAWVLDGHITTGEHELYIEDLNPGEAMIFADAVRTPSGANLLGDVGSIMGLTASQIDSVDSETIIGLIMEEQIGSVSAGAIIGTISAGQIDTIDAGQITGSIDASQIGSVNAGDIVGDITAGQIDTITAGQITGSITSGQIGSVAAGTITGSITSGQIGSVAAGTITGTITSGQIATVNAGQVTVSTGLSDISANMGSITAGTITGATFRTSASNPRMITDSAGWRAYDGGGGLVANFQTVDGSLVIAGELTAEAGSVIPTSVLDGQVDDSQISDVGASKITGSITASQIGSVNAGAITGDITAGQIDTVNAADITGTITAGQIDTVNASDITGGIVSTQITSINAATITVGTISSSQIGSVAAATITGSITAGQIDTINAADITGDIVAGQIDTINANQVTITTGLSDISANLGSITAGTITGATFRTSGSEETTMTATGIAMKTNASTTPALSNGLTWIDSSGLYPAAGIYAYRVADYDYELRAYGVPVFGDTSQAVIMDSTGLSDFVRSPSKNDSTLTCGVEPMSVSTAVSKTETVTHGLGGTPTSVVATCDSVDGNGSTKVMCTVSAIGATTFDLSIRAGDSTNLNGNYTVYWIALY